MGYRWSKRPILANIGYHRSSGLCYIFNMKHILGVIGQVTEADFGVLQQVLPDMIQREGLFSRCLANWLLVRLVLSCSWAVLVVLLLSVFSAECCSLLTALTQ